jgi:hypothetical protein
MGETNAWCLADKNNNAAHFAFDDTNSIRAALIKTSMKK